MTAQQRRPRAAHHAGHRLVRRDPLYFEEGTFCRSEVMASRDRPPGRVRVVHHQPTAPTALGSSR